MSSGKGLAIESLHEEIFPFDFREVVGNTGPDEFTGGVGHLAADEETLGTGLLHHFPKEVCVQVGRGVRYGETRVSISVRFNF